MLQIFPTAKFLLGLGPLGNVIKYQVYMCAKTMSKFVQIWAYFM